MSQQQQRVYVISPDGSHGTRLIEPTMTALQDLVDGYFEPLQVPDPWFADICAYVNEDGRLKRLPLNNIATSLLGFGIVGVMVLAHAADDGASLTDDQVAAIQARIKPPPPHTNCDNGAASSDADGGLGDA